MIYTIGHREIYLKLFGGEKQPHKRGRYEGYQGGSVFRTEAEADIYLEERGLHSHDVFGIEADWDTDTEPHPGQPFHDLLTDAPLVRLGRDYEKAK